jgi:ABC-type nickel/cobalt efflux system permease component RcnA
MSRALVSLSALLVAALPVSAHPIPKDNHDRTIVVRLTPRAVVVEYRLEVDEARAALDMPKVELNKIGSVAEFRPAFRRYFAPVLADNLVAEIDGKRLTFSCVEQRHFYTDHLRCDYRFEAPWPIDRGRDHTFAFRESNYHDLNSVDKLLLSIAGEGDIVLSDVKVADAALQAKPGDQRQGDDDEKLRTAAATVRLTEKAPLAEYRAGLPPDLDPERLPPEPDEVVAVSKPRPPELGPTAARSAPVPGQVVAETRPGPKPDIPPSVRPTPSASDEPEPVSAAEKPHELWQLLIERDRGLLILLVLAAGFGAAHALTPGHGKTLVAAYLIGERGTVWHALYLGLITTLTHTGAVLLAALILWLCYSGESRQMPPSFERLMRLVGGMVVAGFGLWLVTRRLAGKADHVHFGDHSHGHGHGYGEGEHSHSHGDFKWGSLSVLGITGGMIPCTDAIVLLLMAIANNMLDVALPLLLAFSAGLATVLVGIGIGVVYARRHGLEESKWQSERLRKLIGALPMFSAILVTLLGFWLCYDSVHGGK